MKLSIETREAGGVTILACQGRIMFGQESTALRDALKQVSTTGRKVVLNLAGVNYIDSGALGMLVGAYSAGRSEGADIKLAAAGQHVLGVLQTTKLLKIFELYDTEEQALAALGAGTAEQDKAEK
jgi:anti-sigma B factor antagonist